MTKSWVAMTQIESLYDSNWVTLGRTTLSKTQFSGIKSDPEKNWNWNLPPFLVENAFHQNTFKSSIFWRFDTFNFPLLTITPITIGDNWAVVISYAFSTQDLVLEIFNRVFNWSVTFLNSACIRKTSISKKKLKMCQTYFFAAILMIQQL